VVKTNDKDEKDTNEFNIDHIELKIQNEQLQQKKIDLSSSYLKYFELYNLAPVGYCSINENGLFLEVNLTIADLLGITREALAKSRITSFIIAEDKEIYYLHRNKLFETSQFQTFELRMHKRDRSSFWAQIEATITRDLDGLPICHLVVIDISKRKSEEEELKKNEKKFRLLFESTRSAILSTADLRRQAEEKLLSENNMKMTLKKSPLLIESASDIRHELRIHQIELEIQNEELRRTQVELDKSHSRYYNLFDKAPVGYSIINEKGDFLDINLTISTLFNIDKSNMDKYRLTHFIAYEDQDIYYIHRKHLFETEESQTFELRMFKSEGIPFWAHIEMKLDQNDEGDQICYIVIIDISKRRWIESALNEYTRKIKKIM